MKKRLFFLLLSFTTALLSFSVWNTFKDTIYSSLSVSQLSDSIVEYSLIRRLVVTPIVEEVIFWFWTIVLSFQISNLAVFWRNKNQKMKGLK